jgi:hypothetical protein
MVTSYLPLGLFGVFSGLRIDDCLSLVRAVFYSCQHLTPHYASIIRMPS